LGLEVLVGVCVAVGVLEGVNVGVIVGIKVAAKVGVIICVGVGVSVGVGRLSPLATAIQFIPDPPANMFELADPSRLALVILLLLRFGINNFPLD